MVEKRLRWDLFIAVCALLISTMATAASIYQTHVVAQQLSSAVWPYLGIDQTGGSDSVSIKIVNYGLGPALIRSAWLEANGKRLDSYAERASPIVQTGLLLKRHGIALVGHVAASASSMTPGDVLAAGGSKQLIALHVRPEAASLLAAATSIKIHVCYCSLLDQCWELDSTSSQAPVSTRCIGQSEISVPSIGATPLKAAPLQKRS